MTVQRIFDEKRKVSRSHAGVDHLMPVDGTVDNEEMYPVTKIGDGLHMTWCVNLSTSLCLRLIIRYSSFSLGDPISLGNG